MRLKIILVTIILMMVTIALDLIYIQVIRGPYYYNLSVNNRIRVIPLDGSRGVVSDRNGVVLADNRLAFNVTVIPQDVRDKDELFGYLSGILGEDPRALEETFLERKVTPFAPVVVAEDIPSQTAMVLEENKFRFPGLYVQESFRRLYPQQTVGAHVLGYLGKIDRSRVERLKDYGYSQLSVVGYSGVEEYYDSFLRGKEGGLQIEVNSRGQQVRLLSTREPENGQDIQLTIDQRIQKIAFDTLADRPGCILIMDIQTGEILGLVSNPSFDPNIFVDSKLAKQTRQVFVDPAAPLFNRAVMGQYPPGSVFKPMAAIAALDSGKLTPQNTFNCEGALQMGRRSFRCTHRHGVQKMVDAIAHSCNVYFYNVGLTLGPDLLVKYSRLFGLGALTHVDLPFEEKGHVPSRQDRRQTGGGWYRGDTLNISIGQGELLTTPIQLVRMMSSIARSGREVQPHLIKAIAGNEIIKFSTVKNIKIPEETFGVILKGVRSTVTDSAGTARLLDIKEFAVSGKTGTAQSVPGKKEHAWFVGFTTGNPTDIAFCVFLEHGGSSYYACEAARDLLKKMKEEQAL